MFISLILVNKIIIYKHIYRIIYLFIITFPIIYFFSRLIIYINNDYYSFYEIFFLNFGELRGLVNKNVKIDGLPTLYKEQSHLNMIASFILINSFFLFSYIKKNKFIFIISYLFYLIIITINFSSTIFYGYLISLLFIYLFNIRKLNTRFIVYSLLVFLLLLIFKNFDHKSREQTKDLYLSLKNFKEISYLGNENLEKNKINDLKFVEITNLSFEVLLFNLKVSIRSFIENKFGHGFNSYSYVHDKYSKSIPNRLEGSNWLNSTNGSNILIKSFAEFGIVAIFFGLLFLLVLFNNKISYKKKIIIISGVMTVIFIRGAGYVSAGFLLFISFYFSEIYNLLRRHYIHKY